MSEEKKYSILDLFKDEEITETNAGYKTTCPDCGLQGDRTEGLILHPEKNIAYCHSSCKWFTLLETYAMKKGIIRCIDGREKGQKGTLIPGEQFKETLDELEEEFDVSMWHMEKIMNGLCPCCERMVDMKEVKK